MTRVLLPRSAHIIDIGLGHMHIEGYIHEIGLKIIDIGYQWWKVHWNLYQYACKIKQALKMR